MAATPFPSGPGGCAVQVLRLPLHGTPGPKGRPRNDREDAGAAGSRAHAKPRQVMTMKVADEKGLLHEQVTGWVRLPEWQVWS